MKNFASWVIKYRFTIIVLFSALSIIFGINIPKVKIEPEMKAMLPKNMESRMNTEQIDEIFGGTDMLMVVIKSEDVLKRETLERVKKISREMKRVNGVDKVLSLFELKSIKGEDGTMVVNPAVKSIPQTNEEKESLRKEIEENDLVYGSVVSKDFTLTGVIALLKSNVSDREVLDEINRIIHRNPGKEEVLIGGLPHLRVQVTKSIQKDLKRFLPLGVSIMLIFLLFCFKQLRGVVLPFLIVIMSIMFSMGLIHFLGWKIHVITVILPVMLIAIANDYGIHLIARYQELLSLKIKYTRKELAETIFSSMSAPVLFTGLTTISGMLCLMGHFVVPARQLGILASAGIFFALTASLFMIPALISLIPEPKRLKVKNSSNFTFGSLEKILSFIGDSIVSKPRVMVVMFLILTVLLSCGIFFLVIDTDPNRYFPRDHPVVYASEIINRNLGGAQNVSVVIGGDIKDPRLMRKIDELERRIEKIPEVGLTNSIARVLRQMSRALNDRGEEGYDKIPTTRDAIAQYFELYAMSGDPEDFEKLVDFPYQNALITARIKTGSTHKINKVLEEIKSMVKNDRDVKLIGGFGAILSQIAKKIVSGQLISLLMAIVVIGILIILLFRSFVAGLISSLPLAISVSILFGLMGIFGIELNISTAMLSSIMIGVGVDYTIHFLWRYREERQNGLSPEEGVKKTLSTTGRGIVFNAFSVIIGFVILFISSFLPVRFFGFLVVASIFSCLCGGIVLVPSLSLLFRPKFLEPSGKKTKGR